MKKALSFLAIALLCVSCAQPPKEHRVVVCVPVYGQSLALGEEAERLTDFDSLSNYADGRIVTENLDYDFGYYEFDDLKKMAKKMVKYQKRSFELSIYTMAQRLVDQLGKDTLICIFPGGQGATQLSNLSKGTRPYQEFLEDIEKAYKLTKENGWDFKIPAICWMQGESDIEDYPNTNYQKQLSKIWKDMNTDIHQITQQQDTVRFICYQTNSLARGRKYDANNFHCIETAVPQTFVNMLRDNQYFWASGPTYPYHCVDEKIHIDANGQQHIGELSARSVLGILRGSKRNTGLIPTTLSIDNQNVIISFNTLHPPLKIDTLQVRKADNYGFSVITKDNRNIAQSVILEGYNVRIICTESPQGCKVRYAVNGNPLKSGNQHGPRGNLRDSSGNWCYMFDQPL